MKEYLTPKIEIKRIEMEDILTSSGVLPEFPFGGDEGPGEGVLPPMNF